MCIGTVLCPVAQWAELPRELHELTLSYLDVSSLAAFAAVSRATCTLTEDATDRWRQLFVELYPGFLDLLQAPANRKRWSGIVSKQDVKWRELHRAVRERRSFQAQVFNREMDNSLEDFTNSCYDATVSYQGMCPSSGQPLFSARYLPMGKERVEERGITLARLRPVPAASHAHHVARWSVARVAEGDEVEVQWRGDKAHPFGWWCGVVRRVLRTSVVIEFPQYPHNSPWRSVLVPVSAAKGGVVNVDRRFGYLGGLRSLSNTERAQWAVQRAASAPTPAGSAGEGGDTGGNEEEVEGAGHGLAAVLASAAEMAEEVGLEVDPEQVGMWVQLEVAAHMGLQPGMLLPGLPQPLGLGGWLMELAP